MKNQVKTIAAGALAILLILAAAGVHSMGVRPAPRAEGTGQIYLYGEFHGEETHFEKELALWSSYYHNNGMRDLFIEFPYCTAEYMNLWMQTGDEELLDTALLDYYGESATYDQVHIYIQAYMDFYKRIREDCPETVFHGTDVDHCYDTTGTRFLEYLESTGQADTEQYRLAQENMEQGRYYENNRDETYRENQMAENFIREMDRLDRADVMGIYGSAHTALEGSYEGIDTLCMGSQLHEKYGDRIHAAALPEIVEPLRTETITVGDQAYTAQYFGKNYYPYNGKVYRELWRLEDVFDDFRYNALTFEYLPYDSYPMTVKKGDVLIMDVADEDGSVVRTYHRAEDFIVHNDVVTAGFLVE